MDCTHYAGFDYSRCCYHSGTGIELPTYGVYLMGFTIAIMFFVIIGLALALYLTITKKQTYALNLIHKEFARNESTQVATLYNNAYDEQDNNKDNGSTLTMNSGIIEINRVSDPETVTRVEDSKVIFTKRPYKPIVPVMHRGQMDAICKEVLRKVQKSDSASFRDLTELLKGKSEDNGEGKPEAIIEVEKEKTSELKTETKNELQIKTELIAKTDIKNDNQDENKTKVKIDTEKEPKTEIKSINDIPNEVETELKSVVNRDVKIEVDHVKDNISAEDSETETVYDTVPSPVRYRQSGDTNDFDLYGISVYDCPPRRSYDGNTRNVIQMDQDTQYMLPLTTDKTDSCYVNCKSNRHSYSS